MYVSDNTDFDGFQRSNLKNKSCLFRVELGKHKVVSFMFSFEILVSCDVMKMEF